MKREVLISGAGPTGLMLACHLKRHGLDVLLIDKKEGITNLSKALGVQNRTVEVYGQLGLAEKAVEFGEKA